MLDKVCDSENNNYIFNKNSYKKMHDLKLFEILIDDLKEYYHKSKLYYLTDCNKYNKFLTIIRQICKYNNIEYYIKITYERSKYSQTYYINKTPSIT